MSYQKTILPNKIRVISEKANFKSVALAVCFTVGSRDEKKEENGISHFIEHLLFKGTNKRTAKDIAIAIDSIGGEINGYTTTEFIYIYAKFLSPHIDTVWEIVADMITNSRFDEKSIEIEKKVVVEEIKTFNDTPTDQLFHLLFSCIYDSHPLSFPIMGTEENVSKFTRNDIIHFQETHYRGENIIIAAYGDIEHKKLVELASNLTFNINTQLPNHQPNIPTNPPIYKKLEKKDLSQTYFAMGINSIPYNSEKKYAWLILETLFGGSISSRLFQNIRENQGLVYEISSFLKLFKDTGVFGVYFITDPKNKDKALTSIYEEFKNLKSIKEDEINRAKEQIKGNMVLGLESPTPMLYRLLINELYKQRYVPIDESIEKINRVKKDEIMEIVEKNFIPEIYFKAEVSASINVL